MSGFAFQQPFDARTVEPSSFPDPPVLADYHVWIVGAEGAPTKDNTGGYLRLDFQIKDPGPYFDRVVSDYVNLFHTNSVTVEIAAKHLSAICHVTGVMTVQDAQQFFGIPFIAKIGPQTKDPRFAQIFAIKDLNGNEPGKKAASAAAAAPAGWAAPAAQAAPAPAPPAAPRQPWETAPAAPAPAAAPAAPAPAAAPAQPAPWQPAPVAAQPAPATAWQPGAAAPTKPPWER